MYSSPAETCTLPISRPTATSTPVPASRSSAILARVIVSMWRGCQDQMTSRSLRRKRFRLSSSDRAALLRARPWVGVRPSPRLREPACGLRPALPPVFPRWGRCSAPAAAACAGVLGLARGGDLGAGWLPFGFVVPPLERAFGFFGEEEGDFFLPPEDEELLLPCCPCIAIIISFSASENGTGPCWVMTIGSEVSFIPHGGRSRRSS